jgi:dTDP-4-dehydrorhamnose reductase
MILFLELPGRPPSRFYLIVMQRGPTFRTNMSIPREKILITGAGGMLGSYARFGIPTTRAELDVENLESVRTVVGIHKPAAILHFAAATDLIATGKDPLGTFRANAMGAYNVALAAKEVGAKIVMVSSSAVFDGKKDEPYLESDVPNPQNEYGHSKYMGELAVAGITDNHLIARTCWMFGGGEERDHKFVANILRQLDKARIEIIQGKRGSPTYGKHFVDALLGLIDEDARGIVHIGNEGAPTRVDIAREIVRITGASVDVVEMDAEAFEKEYPGAGSRGNESISSERCTLPSWQDALTEYIQTEWSDYIRT